MYNLQNKHASTFTNFLNLLILLLTLFNLLFHTTVIRKYNWSKEELRTSMMRGPDQITETHTIPRNWYIPDRWCMFTLYNTGKSLNHLRSQWPGYLSLNCHTYPAPTNYPGVMTTLGLTVVHVWTCMNSMCLPLRVKCINKPLILFTLCLFLLWV